MCLSGWEGAGRPGLQVGTTGRKWACGRLADEGSRVSRSCCLPSAQRLGCGSDRTVAAPRGLASGWDGVSGNGPHPSPPYLAHGSGMVHPGNSCPTCPCLGKGARVLGTRQKSWAVPRCQCPGEPPSPRHPLSTFHLPAPASWRRGVWERRVDLNLGRSVFPGRNSSSRGWIGGHTLSPSSSYFPFQAESRVHL